jgi:hypothetical protein
MGRTRADDCIAWFRGDERPGPPRARRARPPRGSDDDRGGRQGGRVSGKSEVKSRPIAPGHRAFIDISRARPALETAGPYARPMSPAPLVRVRLVRAGSVTYRVGVLTPYFVQTIADEARRAARVDVELAGDADPDAVVDLYDAFARMRIVEIRCAAGVRAGGAASASVATASSRRRGVRGRASRALRGRPSSRRGVGLPPTR